MFTIHIYNHLQHQIELISTLKFEFFNRFLPCGIISNKNLINISESKRKKKLEGEIKIDFKQKVNNKQELWK